MKEIETELKLDVPPGFHLPDVTIVPGLSLVSQPERTMVADYYDTFGLDLARWGATLRYRQEGEGSGTWTVKLDTGAAGQETSRYEIDLDGPPEAVPQRALGLTMGLRRGRPLEVVARLTTTRRAHLLLGPSGGRLAELDDDLVSFVSHQGPSRRGSFREVEIELAVPRRGGDETSERSEWIPALYTLLADSGAKPNDGRPKLMRALTGVPAPLGERPWPGPEARVGELVPAVAEADLRALLAAEVGLRAAFGENGDADIAEALRSVEQLEAHLAYLSPLMDPDWARAARRGLRPLAGALRGLGAAADLEAWLRSERSRADFPDRAPLDELVGLADAGRREARERLVARLESEAHGALVHRLFGLVEGPPLREPGVRAGAALRPMLARRWHRLRRAAAANGQLPQGAELATIHRRARRCRYAADMSRVVLGARARRLSEGLAGLDRTLEGAATAEQRTAWLREAGAGGSPERAMVAGALIGAQRGRSAAAGRRWSAERDALLDKKVAKWLASS